MKNAVNTIARGIEAGALKTGASQYLEAIEAAQKKLADNQILFVTLSLGGIAADDEPKEVVVLQQYENPITGIDEIYNQYIKEMYFPSTVNFISPSFLEYVNKNTLEKVDMGDTQETQVFKPFMSEAVNIKEDIHLPKTLTLIGPETFVNVGKKSGISIYIPDTVTEIGENAFQGVTHIYYNGTATGEPWGALAMN